MSGSALRPEGAAGAAAAASPVLSVRGLVTRFPTREGTVHAVEGISYDLGAGESLAIVGESGCGKSVSALSLLGLVPRPGRVVAGEVVLHGRDLLQLPERDWQAVRGREIAMVFQDPMTSLNPVLTVGRQLTEGLVRHRGLSPAQAREEAVELLRLVGIPDAAARLSDHPHHLSGGQRQRVMLAIALSCRPAVLVADEPTTALDVTIQAQIVALVKDLQARLGMAIVWITHDLALVAGLVDRVAVMYAGSFLEVAPVRELYARPRHPYTVGLLRSLPGAGGERRRLSAIEGRPPSLMDPPSGCAFAPRCPLAAPVCLSGVPPLVEVAPGHATACLRWKELGQGAVDPVFAGGTG
ncbi:MAG TPA: ABC transporter ATP-binding protein [Longimicrobiales bacterium]|nr:ABC transporter ATP-binding protein [Longimicrobiales bacterium]